MKYYLKICLITILVIISNRSFAELRLKGKVAVITGASRGIGVEIAKLFAQEGAKVVLLSRTENDLKKVVVDIEKNNGVASYIVGDVSCYEDLQKMASFAMNKYKRIDILVHNAGRYDDLARVDEMSQETWKKILQSNLDSTFYAVKAVLPFMKKEKYGRIIFISSISGPRVGLPGASNYTASKAGMNGFMKSIAIELAKYNINVNAVEPGNIITLELEKACSKKEIANRIKAIPMGRLGTSVEIAQSCLFLASGESNYITGQSIIVDGGQTLPETHYGDY